MALARRALIISSVNFIFEQIMSETVGQVKYDDEEKLIAKADYSEIDEPETEYHIVASKPENPWQIDEANHIADIIENTVGKLQKVRLIISRRLAAK